MKQINKTNQNGFTLVEILIALALGVLISSALIQVLSGTKQLSNVETALSRLQETGRFALDAIVRDIRMAGYQGCADSNNLEMTVLADDLKAGAFFNPIAIAGYEVIGGQLKPDPVAGDVIENIEAGGAAAVTARPGTDAIAVNFANTLDVELTNASAGDKVITSDNPAGLADGDFALISDCKSAHLVEITVTGVAPAVTYTHAANNSPTVLIPGYQKSAKLMAFENRTYYVGDTGRTTASGATVYALYVREFAGPPQELLEGVENLQIQYGQQLSDGNIRYVIATDPTLVLSQVVSLRIGILAQSYEQVADQDDTRTYNLPGASITDAGIGAHSGDKALRKTFTATIKLRNRRQES